MRYKQIGFESTLTKPDYRSAVYFNMLFRKRAFCGLLIAAAALALAVPALGMTGLLRLPVYLFYGSAALLALLALYFIKLELSIRQFIASDKLSVGSIREITVFDDSIVVSGGKGRYRTEYRWKMFHKGYELRRFFLLYINDQHALILPKRDVPAYDIAPLRGVLRAGLGKKLRVQVKEKEPPQPQKETAP